MADNNAPKTESEVGDVLAQRFSEAKGFAFLRQVRNSTGFSHAQTRYADAIAIDLWPSRGLAMHGIEIKVSRADLKREIEDPAKAESIAQYCDFWWIAVSDRAIIGELVIPAAWGVICCRTGKPATVRKATKTEAKPISRALVASILRNQDRDSGEANLQRRIDAARAKGYSEGYEKATKRFEARVERSRETTTRRHPNDRTDADILKDIEKGLGRTINRGKYQNENHIDPKMLGQAIRLLEEKQRLGEVLKSAKASLSFAQVRANRMTDRLGRMIDELESAGNAPGVAQDEGKTHENNITQPEQRAASAG